MIIVQLQAVHMLHPDPLTAAVELTPDSYQLTRGEAILLPPGDGRQCVLTVHAVVRKGSKSIVYLRQLEPSGFVSQDSFYSLAQLHPELREAAYHPDIRQALRPLLDKGQKLAVYSTIYKGAA